MALVEIPKQEQTKTDILESVPDESEITGVTVEKRSPLRRFLKDFFDEGAKDFDTWAFLKGEFFDFVKDSVIELLEVKFWGRTGSGIYSSPRTFKSSSGPTFHYDYANVGTNKKKSSIPTREPYTVRTTPIDELIFDDRGQLSVLIQRLRKQIANSSRQRVTVAYLYHQLKLPYEYTDEYRGWTSLTDDEIRVISKRGKYRLILPDPVQFESLLS